MGFQISPGVSTTEIDLTTVVPAVSTTAGAFAGAFVWGPVNKSILIDSEITLNSRFGSPDSNTYISYYSAANFLSYGNNLNVVRSANTSAHNATSNSASLAVQIANEDVFEASYLHTNNQDTLGAFVARYPGVLGNSLEVVVCANTTEFTANTSWTGAGYNSLFTAAPGTSSQAAAAGGANDELHIVVVDTGGKFTGVKNTVLETFAFLSKASDSIDALGNSNYYKNVIFNKSKYVYALGPIDYNNTNSTWGLTSSTVFYTPLNKSLQLSSGTDAQPVDADLVTSYGLFSNADTIDISLVVTGGADVTVQQSVIDNIVTTRKDCVAFISPPASYSVINNAGNESAQIQAWITALARSSSYVVADSGWKYQFDKYNNVYRWIPLNADVAGLCVNTDNVRDPWYSPAGFNRGAIKNAVKLAWNPSQTYRDAIYSIGVNPVVSFPGQGIVLYGDKTLQSKPSAFDRINVRRLFIVLEKAIAKASKYSLFEFNDEFTRAQFVATVEPFLRDVQGRRGVTDFKVVCDTTNNTPQVIDSNQFVGDIYIKPARSINFIQLNFIAVRTGVSFTEVVGAR